MNRLSLALLLALCMSASASNIESALNSYQSRDFDQALKSLNALVESDASSESKRESLFHLARIQFRIGNTKSAFKTVNELLEAYPDYADGHYLAGLINLDMIRQVNIFKKAGFGKRALAEWQKTVEIDPDNLNGQYALFSFYANAPRIAGGDKEIAKQKQLKIAIIDSGYGALAAGMLLAKEKQPAEAEAKFKEALQTMDSAGPYFALAQFYMGDEQYEKAAEAAEAFRTNPDKTWWDPDITVVHLIIARANQELGNSEKAREQATLGLSLKPNDQIREMLEDTLDSL